LPPDVPELQIPEAWQQVLPMGALQPVLDHIASFLSEEVREGHEFFPSPPDIFRALELTPPETLKAVILGQDPYHGPGQAHGLSFSVPKGVLAPPSLNNVLTEYQDDLGLPRPHPRQGDLTPWASQGVLLLNTSLTVRNNTPLSHARVGWSAVTDAILRHVQSRTEGMVVHLWGMSAQAKAGIFEGSHHRILKTVHPSPLSAHRGWFGSKSFSRTNEALTEMGRSPVDWTLPAPKPAEATALF